MRRTWGGKLPEEFSRQAALPFSGKSSPVMLDCWQWIDSQHTALSKVSVTFERSRVNLGEALSSWLLDSLCLAGPGPLCGLCLELWEKHKQETRYLPHAVVAALLTRPAAEVYDEFSPYVPTMKPLLNGTQKQYFHDAVLRGLSRVGRKEDGIYCVDNVWPTAQPLDSRWIKRLTHSVWKTVEGGGSSLSHYGYGESLGRFDPILMRLVDPSDPDVRKEMVPYLRERMRKDGSYQTYSRWLFALGGSPRGVLKDSMLKSGKPAYLHYIWGLLNDAAKVLPAEEVVALCQEVLEANCIRAAGKEEILARQVLPWTIEQLRAGKPFPDWDEWWKMRP